MLHLTPLLGVPSLPWKVIGYGALAAGIFIAGWWVNGWRWEAKWNDREAELAQARAKTLGEYREREHVLQEALALVDAERTAERNKAREENDRLRAAVDAGAVRLRVRAACPVARVPETPARAGVDHGAQAELDAEARSDYFALRDGIIEVEKALAACQDILRKERAQ